MMNQRIGVLPIFSWTNLAITVLDRTIADKKIADRSTHFSQLAILFVPTLN
jgi:hypothetical protein